MTRRRCLEGKSYNQMGRFLLGNMTFVTIFHILYSVAEYHLETRELYHTVFPSISLHYRNSFQHFTGAESIEKELRYRHKGRFKNANSIQIIGNRSHETSCLSSILALIR